MIILGSLSEISKFGFFLETTKMAKVELFCTSKEGKGGRTNRAQVNSIEYGERALDNLMRFVGECWGIEWR